MPARRPFPNVDLDLVEEVARVNYLGGVWLTRGLLPGLRPAAGGRAHAHRQRRLRRRRRRLRSVRGLHGRQARPARVLALAAGNAARKRHRRPLDPAGLRRDGGLPAAGAARAPVHAPHRRAARAGRRGDREGARARRGREIVVPWFPYRPAIVLYGVAPGLMAKLGDRAVAKNRAFRAKMNDARRRASEHAADRRVAVVTGASSGIGEATARLLARAGLALRARRAPRGRAPAPRLRARRARRGRGLRRRRPRGGGGDDRAHPRAAPRDRPARQQRRHPRARHFVDAAARRDRAALAVNYLGCVWVTRGLLDGLREAARDERDVPTLPRSRRSAARSSSRPRALLRLEVRAGRVLALAAGLAARLRRRGAHDPARVRDDARASRIRRSSRRCSAGRS